MQEMSPVHINTPVSFCGFWFTVHFVNGALLVLFFWFFLGGALTNYMSTKHPFKAKLNEDITAMRYVTF